MSHGSARLTVHGRRLIVQRHQAGWKQAHIAAAMGVSRKCVKTWIDRYTAEGEDGLATRSSRPHSMPTKTSNEVEQKVLTARAEHRDGPDVLGAKVGVPARTVSRILRRHHVPYLRELDPITGEVIRSSKQTATRYERERPGELVHMDVKKLGKIPAGGGWKAHGRGAGSIMRDRNTKVGFDFVHSLVDDHSRLAYSEVLPDEKGPTCAAFLERAIDYFAAHGITRIERLMTDNAWAYRWSLRAVCAEHDIKQRFIKPHCPWQNGKVERLNRTLTTEWAYRRAFASNDERVAALAPWLEHYNTERRHSALGGKPPISRLLPT
ncbi:IS481 family transposase [Pimelobacter simplex]|uniref:IS481 family transposase n=1 Tax=Nocardioides simplex TaxID=2045 RepID=UPI00214FD0C1|nr:IS481 family transposase [Pimelobacter simplex]UUW87348.1 IS481 family transposase [Pimelobacter simplex]UUW87885.1 IS481 family transposase [Pimelobacter simplex]UUW88599.1 IS481 family transposase [Pimelobacter simplex]UUW88739.1 IS481 family transposase [Pimelobacter simplex]UUW88748.1 IS481 family transposase [Pimelobacter simplex]